MRYLRYVVIAFVLSFALPALAVQPDEVLSDAGLEARARTLSQQLRCLVCQNQSIDDSEAPLARDLRILLRERLKNGDSDRQVMDFLVARYGEFVLLKPPLSWRTALLWLGPPALLIVGGFALFVLARRRSPDRASGVELPAVLTSAEEVRLAQLADSSKTNGD